MFCILSDSQLLMLDNLEVRNVLFTHVFTLSVCVCSGDREMFVNDEMTCHHFFLFRFILFFWQRGRRLVLSGC